MKIIDKKIDMSIKQVLDQLLAILHCKKDGYVIYSG